MASRFWAWTHGYITTSVLPRIAGAPTRSGYRVVVDRTQFGEAVSWGCVIVMVIGCGFIVLYDLLRPHPDLWTDLTLVSVAVGALAAARQFFLKRRFRKGTLEVTPWPLRLGSHARAELRAFTRDEQAAPAARLECAEEAIRDKGTRYETTKSNAIYSCDLSPSSQQWNSSYVHAVWEFDIPKDGVSSFQIRDRRMYVQIRKLEWRVVATIGTSGGETAAEFPLLVLPEVLA